MSRKPTPRSWLALAVAAFLASVAGVAAYLVWRANSLPRPGSRVYEEMVSAFSSGVAALDTDANVIARDALARATGLVPKEPAAWADLGLAQIRLGNLDDADSHLAKAISLAPESGEIERLIALLESRKGRFAESIAHLKRAIEKNPRDLRSRYALAQELERQGDGEAEAVRVLGEILTAHPDNLAVLLDRARLSAKTANAEALSDSVKQLGTLSRSWPAGAQERFRALEQVASGKNPRLAATRVIVLRNVLMTVPAFRQSIDAVVLPIGTVGEPLEKFLRLAVPSPTPAPLDRGISFNTLPAGNTFPPQADAVFALPNAKDDTIVVLTADGHAVNETDELKRIAPFPGGPVPTAPSPFGVATADWNSDNRIDLVLAGAGGVRFFRQEEDGKFIDASAATGLGPEALNADAFGVWTADVEMDGDLDFVVGMRSGPTMTLLNHGDGTFEVARPFAAIADLRGFGWADLDRDGDPDGAFLDARGVLTVLDNQRSGQFRPRAVPSDLGPIDALTIADLNGDGAMDVILLGADSVLRLSDRDEGRSWESVAIAALSEAPDTRFQSARVGVARLFSADLDNNGGLDLIATSPGSTWVWLSDQMGQFQLMAGPDLRVFAVADLDDDGRLDLAGLLRDGKVMRALGRGTMKYHWQVIRPRAAKAEGDGRINSFGVGGEIQVRARSLVQTQIIDGPNVHFGLGTHATADVARVVWPNGTMQAEFKTDANRAIVAEQRLKGSCPFVYAYDGTKMAFVTDFLWRSPLGLRINAQDTAGVSQTEDWIKIRGDQLAPRGWPGNEYDIRLTAELWETHFWDQVSLMVVDHPKDTEVFVDERFARSPPALKVHTTGKPRPVTSARDDQGRDVIDRVRARDGAYLDTFGRGFYQGVTRDHWVEVEIGDDVPEGRKLVLIAEGWIHPTDSSINVALGQGKHDAPRGLSLEVPTAEGGWVEARDDLGFPAGKNKTVLVDLDGAFRPGAPRRLRLRTNLEIYWDAIAVATSEDRPLKTRRISPSPAVLRHRGYSRITPRTPSSPEVPQYDILTGTAQRWNDLIGLYTRFGNVTELLEKVDDRYVIANAGDEVILHFPAEPPPPQGWARDFVLIGDGWNKDGDYNTAYSKTVLPLPSHERPAYNTPPGELEDDPVYRKHPRDWEEYHTRFITPRTFWDGLRPEASRLP